jgi:hypothetical protein
VATTEIRQLRLFQTRRSEVEALVHCRIAAALTLQHQVDQAGTHYVEALRLAERACELTGYEDPMQLGALACVYADVGSFDKALATATKGRDLALARGQNEIAERLLKLIEGCNARKSARDGARN